MLWLLQNNYVDGMTAKLAWVLQQANERIHDFSLVPGEPLPRFAFDPCEPHFFYGSTGLARRLREDPRWAGSLFDGADALDQRTWTAHLGENMLNAAVEFMPFGDLLSKPPSEEFFVRPVLDAKAFDGQVVRGGDFSVLRRARRGQHREIAQDLLVAVSPVVPSILPSTASSCSTERCVLAPGTGKAAG